jgi:hypothetical protein
MKLRFVMLLAEQKVFGARPMVSILPDRDKVDLELVGDWVIVRSLQGERKGQTMMLHGSRCAHVEPEQDPLEAKAKR